MCGGGGGGGGGSNNSAQNIRHHHTKFSYPEFVHHAPAVGSLEPIATITTVFTPMQDEVFSLNLALNMGCYLNSYVKCQTGSCQNRSL